ncbi:glycosyl transferase group 1 [Gloeothece citriformis PCC 7424]|uniref:Glycosyl transferase group 1 n=1 Tax=Gloeothece citriformis (strain PCC 7424) TaxID=65393 RepID=B7KLJ6_GLOC7|nr:glycosyltransferase family 4 protein [Gloeothece citriformis]ACK72568.1 glycosyl transferase group 1 [Gloeothece citriformis PCC 7424]
MKILLINDYGTATGGAELQMLSLRQNLIDRGHEVRLFSSKHTPVVNSPLLSDYECFGTDKRLQVLSQTVNPSAYFRLRHALADFQPDVVHIRMFLWQLSPLILPLLKNIPCLYQTATYIPICPSGTKLLPNGLPCSEQQGLPCLRHGCVTPQTWAVLMLQRQLFEQWRSGLDLVVALSHAMKEKIEAAGIKPVEVVYNGVPERPLRPPLPNLPLVAFAGRLVPEKGVSDLIKAFAQAKAFVPDAQLTIAGQGVEQNNLQALAEKLGIAQSINWLGHISRDELEKRFDAAWVQVVPSLWDEPFGNVTTEAMMRGTAVIANAVGAQPEIVQDGETGYIVPPQDIEALKDALVRLLMSRDLAEKMGQAGRDRAMAHFSENRRTENFLNLYQRIQGLYNYPSKETLSLI